MKSYFWVYWELLLAGRGKRDRQNFREKFSPKIIHLKTIFSIFFGPTFFSTSGCEELFLGILGAAAGRKREEGSSKFSRKIFSKNNTSENYFFRFFSDQLFSRPPVVKSYFWVYWELLLAGRGKRDRQNFREKFFSKNNTSENYFFDFFRTNFFSTSGCEELFLGLLGAAAGRKREEGSSKIFAKNFLQK